VATFQQPARMGKKSYLFCNWLSLVRLIYLRLSHLPEQLQKKQQTI